MKTIKFLSWAFIACLMMGVSSCSEDLPEPSIEVSVDTNGNIQASGSTLNISISANVDWSVKCDADWITAAPASGTNSGNVTLTVAENTSYDSRTAKVTIGSNDPTAPIIKEITITQDGKDKPTYHIDLMASVGGTTGMSSTGVTSTLIRNLSVDEIEDNTNTISFKGIGVDIQAEINSESIIHKGYYYEAAPLSQSWYGKYIINDNKQVNTVARFEMGKSVFKAKQYTHAWISDNTVVCIGADKSVSNRGSNKVLTNTIQWSRVKDNGATLSLEAEGTLDLTTPTKAYKEGGVTAFSTSGLAAYRASDNTLIYAFVDNDLTPETALDGVFIAFIDPTSMEVKKVIYDKRVDTLAGTAYGELQQDKLFFDENDDLYIGAELLITCTNSTSSTPQYGRILRIKNGATDTDKDYLGFSDYQNGKILSMDYLGSGKIAMTMQDPLKTGLTSSRDFYAGWGQNELSIYYAVYDIASGKVTDLDEIPYSLGSFTDRVAVTKDKCYIASCPDSKVSTPCIYIYDIATGKITKGANIEAGYYINRLNIVDNLD